jgi:hypothetical protein
MGTRRRTRSAHFLDHRIDRAWQFDLAVHGIDGIRTLATFAHDGLTLANHELDRHTRRQTERAPDVHWHGDLAFGGDSASHLVKNIPLYF